MCPSNYKFSFDHRAAALRNAGNMHHPDVRRRGGLTPGVMYERVVVKRVVHGGVNRETFLKFLRECVQPLAHMMRQQLVHRFGERARVALLMDNAAIHKGEEVARCMEQDAYVQFVPPYSPDLNLPIEGLFKDTKSYLLYFVNK